MVWTYLDTWLLLAMVLTATACAIPGCFLLLRRMSLVGDAISHAVLPGIVFSFLLTGQRASIVMFIGAATSALLLVVVTEFLKKRMKVESSAGLGVVFSIFFALGLVFLVQAADSVDLDPNCVLYGAVELAVLHTFTFFGISVPHALPILLAVVLLNITVTLVFYKELNLISFDSNYASFQGFRPTLLHYILMIEVGITMVAIFQIAGSILSIAMLILPAAIARLFTKTLHGMIIMAVIFAIISSIFGHAAVLAMDTFWLPGANLAGMTVVSAGLILVISLFMKQSWQTGLK